MTEEPQQSGPEETSENEESLEKPEEEVKSFSELIENDEFVTRLSSLGFNQPTPVQAAAIPTINSGDDLLVQAQTGSGKTLAFSIPLIMKLEESQPDKSETAAIVLSPTRELAVQIADVVTKINSDFSPVLVIGGTDMNKQIKKLKNDSRIVIGTPGRVLDLIRQRKLQLKKCKYVVLDEADEMLSMGFIQDVRAILATLPKKRQGVFVSATITGRVELLARSFLNKPQRAVIGSYESDLPDIRHCYLEVGGEILAKPSALSDIIEVRRPESAIIFCNTKSDTKLVEALLRRRGLNARRINSDLTQKQRDKIMQLIRNEELQFLVATDIAARGLDIEQLELVINYNIHDQAETYLHRTGRTGRAGRSGTAISLVGPHDHSAFYYLKQTLDIEFEQIEAPSDDEVVEARLSHLYEALRKTKLEIGEREVLVAKTLLKELGAIDEPTDELTSIVTQLSEYAIEHLIQIEAQSLDEELAEAEKSSSKQKEGPKEKKKRDRDRDKPREKRSEERDSSPRDDQDGDKEAEEKEEEEEEFRVYIGQGLTHGMTAELFTELASTKAGIPEDNLRKLIFRELYGFVDLKASYAEALVEKLNGTTQNDEELLIERAVNLTFSKRRPRGPRSAGKGHDKRSRDGGRDRGRDRRRGRSSDSRDRRSDSRGGRGRDRRDGRSNRR